MGSGLWDGQSMNVGEMARQWSKPAMQNSAIKAKHGAHAAERLIRDLFCFPFCFVSLDFGEGTFGVESCQDERLEMQMKASYREISN